ncbi:hypothetical protein Vretimale_14249 [Volvox reticuliferus]|uniref:Uncharacterized protein n=1 Tax=Volvox reticuliferus TaxID=1737510 RepID=A0A8J4CQQ0_9CHLO|nr:hypothetical protein Vretifemale_15238 [Volvox reticuliferus]GIM10630.1 hypothetical protein Vretimale_14249 [Volvox reticuliferus]
MPTGVVHAVPSIRSSSSIADRNPFHTPLTSLRSPRPCFHLHTCKALTLVSCYPEDWPLLVVCPTSLRHTWVMAIQTWTSARQIATFGSSPPPQIGTDWPPRRGWPWDRGIPRREAATSPPFQETTAAAPGDPTSRWSAMTWQRK